jgi:hypothetical protein
MILLNILGIIIVHWLGIPFLTSQDFAWKNRGFILKRTKIITPTDLLVGWLVVSNIFYFPFHIWGVILPIDKLHHFSRWLLHHQPVGGCNTQFLA